LNSRERTRSAATASARRNNRYTSDTNKGRLPLQDADEAGLYGREVSSDRPSSNQTDLRTPQDSGDLGDDLSDLFVALGEAAAEHETGIVFLLDEVQFLDRTELEALIAALHQVSQHELPLTLAGAGLPQLPALTGAAKSYAERLFRFPTIDRLDEQAARDALELPARAEGVEFERAATNRILALTEGYPYFLQEYGKHVWNVAPGPTITVGDVEQALDLVQLDLDESFFRVRIGRATKAELAYLAAMAHLGDGPYRSGEIAAKLGRPGPESVAPTRARLIEKGLIYSPSYGLNEFTVPQFDAFIRRSFTVGGAGPKLAMMRR